MKRIIAIACMLVLLAPMPALAADLVIDAPGTVLVSEPFGIMVTVDGSPVAEAIVICSFVGGGSFAIDPTDTSGATTFTPPTTGTLVITAVKSGHTTGSKTITVAESTVPAGFVVAAPGMVPVGKPFGITVTEDGSPVAEATVICSLAGAQHYPDLTDVSGTTTFTPPTTGTLLITAVKDESMDSLEITVVTSAVTGDLNGDGVLAPADVAIALRMAVGACPPTTAADVNGDGRVTSLDALMILQAVAGGIAL